MRSAEKAAKIMNVSTRAVYMASKVIEHGVPELVALVDTGQLAVHPASIICELPANLQREIVALGQAFAKRLANELHRDERAERLATVGPRRRRTTDAGGAILQRSDRKASRS